MYKPRRKQKNQEHIKIVKIRIFFFGFCYFLWKKNCLQNGASVKGVSTQRSLSKRNFSKWPKEPEPIEPGPKEPRPKEPGPKEPRKKILLNLTT